MKIQDYYLDPAGKKTLHTVPFSADLRYIIIYALLENLTLNSVRQDLCYAI